MAKQLTLDEMLDIGRDLDLPGMDSLVATIESLATGLAKGIAEKLDIVLGPHGATFEGSGFAGTCAPFYAKDPTQECPEALRFYDATEWETIDGIEAPGAPTARRACSQTPACQERQTTVNPRYPQENRQ